MEPNLTPDEIAALNESWREDQARQAYEEARAASYRERIRDRDEDTMMWRRDQ